MHNSRKLSATVAASAVLVASLFVSGCASIQPQALAEQDLLKQSQADRAKAQADVPPLPAALTLEEAIARALKYNLDRRTRMMEEALAVRQLELGKYDMLPKLVAQAGYHHRDKDAITRSKDSVTGQPSLANPYISSERQHTTADLNLTWNLLDFGISYYNAQQQADRVLIATEHRRKAMHVLIQDVRTAFWRVACAQKLQNQVAAAITVAESALEDARRAEAEKIRSPLESLRYQRQLLENLRLLESIDQELSTAKIELASLINAPVGSTLQLAEQSESPDSPMLTLAVERMETLAVAQNADVREQFYNARIARLEVRKTLARLFPVLGFNYGLRYDSDSYLIHHQWNEVGLQLSYNLFNLLTGPTQRKLADAGVTLAEQRRMATQMAVLAQVHIARLQYANAYKQFNRADAIWNVDSKIAAHVANREEARTQSKLDVVANNTTAILSLLRRYQALAQVHGAASKLQASLGLEPNIGSVRELSLQDLTQQVGQSLQRWQQGDIPVLDSTSPAAR